MKVKIKKERISKFPIWRVYDEKGEEIDFYDRQAEEQMPTKQDGSEYDGLTKDELVEILQKKGYEI